MAFDTVSVGSAIVAIGALGTAAFGLVDAMKTLPSGGISNAGYAFIERAVQSFFSGQRRNAATGDMRRLFDTLHGNWINGTPLADQKAIAKSLIKLRLNETTAGAFANATGVDPATLKIVGEKMSKGAKLEPNETNVLGRFDLALTAILDGGYQHADQRYRNASKLAAMVVATVLAWVGGLAITTNGLASYLGSHDMWRALVAGLLAAPLAPISKDLASAVSAGVKAAQAIRK
jgi:hypothetical protein